MSFLSRRRWLILAAFVAILGLLGALAVVVGNQSAIQAQRGYEAQRQQLHTDLRAAEAQGYTAEDLQPITARLATIDSDQAPWWLTTRAQYYKHRSTQLSQLDSDFKTRQSQLLNDSQAEATKQVAAAKAGIDRDRDLGADDADLRLLQQRLEEVARAQGAAHTITDYRNLARQVQPVMNDVNAVGAAQQAENDAIARAAEDMKAQTGGNADALRKSGSDALYSGRNDASIAAYMNKPSPFKGFDALSKAYSRLEKSGRLLDSGDVNQIALGSAGTHRYAAQVHDGLMGNLPDKTIVLSQRAQQIWAFEGGKQVMTTVVTTGKPPDLITDIGPMKVLSKSSPWKMHSPWPKGSPYWYPDTDVQMVLWFTNTGEGLHDASWQPCCWGPGSQFSGYASHGCVHVPFEQERFLFNWAPVGTPVIHYPGDGQPVDRQLAQITTDDQGNPTTGPKGA